ncbi:MAG: MGMT family protein [Peptococcaceae bacterium]|nr:MGMT family protein [Peptococcaceae bacterium]
MPGKTWNEKLYPDNGLPKIVHLKGKRLRKLGQDTMVVPAPAEVDGVMRAVDKGRLITTDIIRKVMAEKHGAATACPMSTGLFTIIAAFASEERAAQGRGDPTPYWRTLKAGGELNEKYPGGIENQRSLLEAEGHRIVRRGRRFFVADHEPALLDRL